MRQLSLLILILTIPFTVFGVENLAVKRLLAHSDSQSVFRLESGTNCVHQIVIYKDPIPNPIYLYIGYSPVALDFANQDADITIEWARTKITFHQRTVHGRLTVTALANELNSVIHQKVSYDLNRETIQIDSTGHLDKNSPYEEHCFYRLVQ